MSAYDKYFVQRGAANHLKFRRLSVAERQAFFMGVLSIAAGAQPRGRLLVGRLEAGAEDVAHEANIPAAVARSALRKLEDVGMLIRDDEPGLLVHDWEDYQPEPKSTRDDQTATRRQQLHRNTELKDAIRARDGSTCRYCGEEVDFTDRRGPRGGTYDHLDPTGPNSLENLVVACRRCNSIKGTRSLETCCLVLIPIKSRSAPEQNGTSSGSNEVEVEEEGTTSSSGGMTPDARPSETAIGEEQGLRVVGDAA